MKKIRNAILEAIGNASREAIEDESKFRKSFNDIKHLILSLQSVPLPKATQEDERLGSDEVDMEDEYPQGGIRMGGALPAIGRPYRQVFPARPGVGDAVPEMLEIMRKALPPKVPVVAGGSSIYDKCAVAKTLLEFGDLSTEEKSKVKDHLSALLYEEGDGTADAPTDPIDTVKGILTGFALTSPEGREAIERSIAHENGTTAEEEDQG